MLNLLLVLHNHQPLGNLPDVFRKAYEIAYRPFLDTVKRHPGIKWALHSSACLWEWFESEEPGYLNELREEYEAGRLELLTGGMWEPIQPLIDKAAFRHHFTQMRSYLASTFGADPVGSWTTERVWEPSLAWRLSEAGVKYTLLDDSQLRAGLPSPGEHRVWGYYRTEYNGKSVAIFPIDEHLRYLIPFQPAEKVIGYLEQLAGELPDNAAVTYGDDGEKFGMWPETYTWVYEKGWLDAFLGRLEESDQVRTMHPTEYMKMMPHPRQRVYIPTSSYREMGFWNLYPNRNLAAEGIYKWVESNHALKSVEPPLVAGLFRTFLARYPESRFMHERTEELIRTIVDKDPDVEPSMEAHATPQARALWHLLRAQCNCPYWHGVFGGLYLNYLRFAVHRSILNAEYELKRSDIKLESVRYIGTCHHDGRGSEPVPDAESPVLVSRPKVQWVLDPMTGQVISAGSVEKRVDVIDVIARRFEAYHATMREADEGHQEGKPASIHDMHEVAPPGWREVHGYDRCRKGCFADWVMPHAPSINNFARVEFKSELGPECGYWETITGKKNLKLGREDGPWHREKKFSFSDDGATAELAYTIARNDDAAYKGFLFLEFNIGLLAGDAPDRYHVLPDGTKHRLDEKFENMGGQKAIVIDEWTGVRVEISVPGAEWYGAYPVKTLARGEAGLELNYQGTCIVFRIPLDFTSERKLNNIAAMGVYPR